MLTDPGATVNVAVISLFACACGCVFLCMYACVSLHASVDSIKESDRKHFCCLDWSKGLGPHNAMFSLFSLNGPQCWREKEAKAPLYLASCFLTFHLVGFLRIVMFKQATLLNSKCKNHSTTVEFSINAT